MELLNLNQPSIDSLKLDSKPGQGNGMASAHSKAPPEAPPTPLPETTVSAWPRGANPSRAFAAAPAMAGESFKPEDSSNKLPSRQDALQALLAFSSLHEQVRRRRTLSNHRAAPADNSLAQEGPAAEFEAGEQFVLDEVLHLVAERALAITGANGLAIALAENNEIVLRARSGAITPDVGARIDRDSAFSGACFRTAQVVRCDDTETDARVNAEACRRLGARSMVAVPLCGRRRVIGLLEAFSSEPFGFNDSDVRSLSLLAELVLGALKPDDEDRFAEAAQAASSKLSAAETLQSPQQDKSQEGKPLEDKPLEAKPQAAIQDNEKIDNGGKAPSDEATAWVPPDSLASVPIAAPVYSPGTEPPSPERHDALIASSAEAGSRDAKENSAPPVEEAIASSRHPGLWVVVALILIFALVAAGIWWTLKHSDVRNPAARAEKSSIHPSGKASGAAKPASNVAATSAAGGKSAGEGISNNNTEEPSDPSSQTASAPNAQELSQFPKVTGIRHWSSSDSSTVVLDLQDQVQYEAHRLTSPDRIYFDLHDTVLAPDLAATNIEIGDALLSRVRVAQPIAGMTRVVLETKGNSNFSVSLETNPYRLVVEVRKIGTSPKGAVNLFPDAERNELAIVVPPPGKEDLQLRARVPKMRIVIDAGHGGWDLGTVGRRGLLEKDVVLEIAQRLGKLLESRLGTEVLYTRLDDSYIPLDERAEIANQAQADLFVSVHANYSDLPSARGVETYYTNFFSAPSPKDLELRGQDSPNHDLRAQNLQTHDSRSPVADAKVEAAGLSPADLHERIEQSRRLAASVQRSLYGMLSVENPGLRDRGIKEAGFVVLTETAMPGILAEVSFVSSPADERRLRSDGYREQIAEALYKGIAHYAANSHGVKVASAAK